MVDNVSLLSLPLDSGTRNALLRLPGELRNQIYRFVIPGSICVISWDTDVENLQKLLPGICKTSRQMHDETIPIFFQNIVWLLPHSKYVWPFAQFLYSFPNGIGFQNIRSVVLQDLSILNTKLLRRCPKLRTLVLVFDGPEIAGRDLIKRGRWKTETIAKTYDLDPIFDLKLLKRLILGFKTSGGWAHPGVSTNLEIETSFMDEIQRRESQAKVMALRNLPWNTGQWVEELLLDQITNEEEDYVEDEE
ncbi:uncharacterized protein BDR25DRAFT_303702 [Lindgomyces ingoldianus]|uniref:Uncharacterized protein n=1 Tax=Lindgomyces ingoldianus TaxID=673940 RepID=A0ACB6QUF5_9PLEO|nr:uncharacterized protein BDR25DRAFT_303702 [Lindgomyces ingoldianus]KAF2470659.1 hypothetical protein BDR25DRAFT_303702 [Lindgomyces ingoldianus]